MFACLFACMLALVVKVMAGFVVAKASRYMGQRRKAREALPDETVNAAADSPFTAMHLQLGGSVLQENTLYCRGFT
jgi:hypothetical protein